MGMPLNRSCPLLTALALAAVLCLPVHAQTANQVRVTAAPQSSEILIGHVAGYTGPVKKTADEIGMGARVFIEAINQQGGVLGKKLRLVTGDDTFKPEETVRLVLSMDGKVSALLPLLGSANMGAVLKQGVLAKISMPVLGAIPSQDSYRDRLHKNLFHFRASDRDQLDKIVEQLTAVGIHKIAVMAPNNPNGKEGAANVDDAMQKRGLKLAARGLYEIAIKADFGPQIKIMTDNNPDAIVFLGPSNSVGEITKQLHAAGVGASLFSVSYSDPKVIVKFAGLQVARGFAIAQVFPRLNNTVLPLIKAFRSDFEKYSGTKDEPTYINLEGYIAARLVVEAIRKSKDASPDGVRRGLEQLRDFDLGGHIVDFSPTRHSGSKWVDLSIIGGKGALIF